MPGGVPNYLQTAKYPTIRAMETEHGTKNILKAIFLLVKDFCGSLNVKHNMSENQMIDVAAMMLDECGNFRLEDYLIMFNMAKRGRLVTIMHSVDITVISKMMDEYYKERHEAGKREQERPPAWVPPPEPVDSAKVDQAFSELLETMKRKQREDEEARVKALREARELSNKRLIVHAFRFGNTVDQIAEVGNIPIDKVKSILRETGHQVD